MILKYLRRRSKKFATLWVDFYVDEKLKQAYLTDAGHCKIEQILVKKGLLAKKENLYSKQHVNKMHYLNTCLRAHSLYRRNIDYIIRNQEVVIIDENTLMRYSRLVEIVLRHLYQIIFSFERINLCLDSYQL